MVKLATHPFVKSLVRVCLFVFFLTRKCVVDDFECMNEAFDCVCFNELYEVYQKRSRIIEPESPAAGAASAATSCSLQL